MATASEPFVRQNDILCISKRLLLVMNQTGPIRNVVFCPAAIRRTLIPKCARWRFPPLLVVWFTIHSKLAQWDDPRWQFSSRENLDQKRNFGSITILNGMNELCPRNPVFLKQRLNFSRAEKRLMIPAWTKKMISFGLLLWFQPVRAVLNTADTTTRTIRSQIESQRSISKILFWLRIIQASDGVNQAPVSSQDILA